MIRPRTRYASGASPFEFDAFELEYKGKTYSTTGVLWLEFEAKYYDGEWIVDWVPEGIRDLEVYDSDDGEEADLHNDRIFRADLTRAIIAAYEDDIDLGLLDNIE